ncbi:MAG: sulfite exporter TauE/SafE family protein [Deltaproteobacteria bacterium]|nr:sulfite exporter TauE/SafE family protein [Deltaproteobacteria bacterium]MBW2395923.1 sulfite exporter TauE/SafE family protein [Deltaproteobacteria bacterium]
MPDLAVLAILTLAAALQGFLGFGFGIVAMSGLTLSHDLLHAAGVVNLCGLVTTTGQLLSLRKHVLWRPALRIAPGLLVGVVFGVLALGTLDRTLMVQALGATTVVIALWSLWRPRMQTREVPALDAGIGLVSGFLGGAFNTGGPPLIAHLYRRSDPPNAIRATVQVLFLTIGTTRAVTAASQGMFDRSILVDAAVAIPAVMLGLVGGFAVARRVGTDRFRTASWVALGVLGIVLILRA